MNTTAQQIGDWFDAGVRSGHRYMVVLCDTFDYYDYPVYCDEEKARKTLAEPGSMQRVMEVYDLKSDKEAQLAQDRCWALRP